MTKSFSFGSRVAKCALLWPLLLVATTFAASANPLFLAKQGNPLDSSPRHKPVTTHLYRRAGSAKLVLKRKRKEENEDGKEEEHAGQEDGEERDNTLEANPQLPDTANTPTEDTEAQTKRDDVASILAGMSSGEFFNRQWRSRSMRH